MSRASRRKAVRRVHAVAGAVAMFLVASFLVATLVSELAGTHADVVRVKRAILTGVLLLAPFMAATAGSGRHLSGRSQTPIVVRKLRRMKLIAANAVLFLVPSALVLYRLACSGLVGPVFYAVQAVEIVAGVVNLTLIGLNFRDGLALRARRLRGRRRARAGAPDGWHQLEGSAS